MKKHKSCCHVLVTAINSNAMFTLQQRIFHILVLYYWLILVQGIFK